MKTRIMKTFVTQVLALPLAAALLAATLATPLAAQESVATVEISGILEYASVGQAVAIEEGVNGAPEVIELGMIVTLVDADDAERVFTGEVTSNFTDNGTPTPKWQVTLIE